MRSLAYYFIYKDETIVIVSDDSNNVTKLEDEKSANDVTEKSMKADELELNNAVDKDVLNIIDSLLNQTENIDEG